MSSDRDDVEEYWLVRRAVRDAIWDVIGTVLTVLVAGALLFFGLALVSQGLLSDTGRGGWLVAAFGTVLLAAAAVQFLREFRLFPFD